MQQKKSVAIVTALSLVLFFGAGFAFAGGAGCSKAAAQHAGTAANGTGCNKSADTANAEGKPCCSRMATEQALAALKVAAEESGSPKAMEAVEAAELAVKKAQDTTGCAKSRAAAEEAAMVAMKNAAEVAGCPKAKAAVETALVAYNNEHSSEAAPDTH